MEYDEIIQGNKLIALFMGLKENGFGRNLHFVDGNGRIIAMSYLLKYNESWNWLIPVVEKIESIVDIGDTKFTVSIFGNTCEIYGKYCDHQHPAYSYYRESSNGNKIKSVFSQIVEFINWYNENNIK